MQNIAQTIISRYQNSPILDSIISTVDTAIDPSAVFDQFITMYMDINTASGVGLDVLGRIIGVGRNISATTHAAVIDVAVIDASIIDSGVGGLLPFILSDADYMAALKLKAFANVTRCTIPAINMQLRNFAAGRGKAWANNYGSMSLDCYFNYALTPLERSMLTNSLVFLKPSACDVNLVEIVNAQIAIIDLAIIDYSVIGT